MIANRPTYEWDRGGDPTLVDANQEGWTYLDKSYGDQNGQPIASRGWRVQQISFYPVWHGTGHFYPVEFVRSDFIS